MEEYLRILSKKVLQKDWKQSPKERTQYETSVNRL